MLLPVLVGQLQIFKISFTQVRTKVLHVWLLEKLPALSLGAAQLCFLLTFHFIAMSCKMCKKRWHFLFIQV